jgi:general secretion pathway protein J
VNRISRGFTLVEVLIALVLMAIMTGLAWRGLDAMLRSREITQQSIERSSVLQTALAQWEQDLEQIQPSGLVGEPLAFDGLHLRFTRRHPQGLQVVVWMLQDGQWSRWASAPATTLAALRQTWERSQQPLVLAGERLIVLSGVSDWQLYYFWDNAWANAMSTGGEAPTVKPPEAPASSASAPGNPASNPPPDNTAQDQPLPKGVRLQLQFAPASGLSGSLVRQVLVPGA